MTLTKKELVLLVAQETGITQVDVKRVIQRTLDRVIDTLKEGKTIELRNFGVFKVRQRAPRRGRNPKTGQEVPITPRRVLVFRASNIMKQRINDALSRRKAAE